MKEINNDTSSQTTSKKLLTKTDFLFPFAVVLLMMSSFELTGTLVSFIISFFEITTLLSLPYDDAVKILTLFLNLAAQIGGIAVIIMLFQAKKIERDERTVPKSNPIIQIYLLYSIELLLLLLLALLVDPLLEPLGESTTTYESIFPSMLLLSMPIYYILFFGVLVFGAAIFEELVFRRSFIPFLERRGLGSLWVLLISSLMFSLMHVPADLLEFLTTGNGGAIRYAINHFFGTFIGGMAFGYLYMRTRDIRWSIIAHGVFNGISGIMIIAETRLNEIIANLGLSLEEFLDLIIDGSITLTGEDLTVFTFVEIGGLFLTLSALVGVGVITYAAYQIAKSQSLSYKPTWINIVTDSKMRKSNLKPILLFMILFIIIDGGMPIFLYFLGSFLGPESEFTFLFLYWIEISVLILLCAILIYFIFIKGKPLEEADYVSPLAYPTEPDYVTPLFYGRDTPLQKSIEYIKSPKHCGSCGTELLPNARFCGFCGFKNDYGDIDSRLNE